MVGARRGRGVGGLNPEEVGPKGYGPKGWGPEGLGALRRTAENFLFFPSPTIVFHSFLPLLGVLSWNFGGV